MPLPRRCITKSTVGWRELPPLEDGNRRIRCRPAVVGCILLALVLAWQVGSALWRSTKGAEAVSPRRVSSSCSTEKEEEVDGKDIHLLLVDRSHLTAKDCPIEGMVCIRRSSRGLIVLYLVGVLYMFAALAIVCDEFFVPSLEAFVGKLNISMDVAGATFMAAGGSTPELFISFIGTFQRSDVGFATIVGSAVFNVLFVVAVCAVASREVLELAPWPLVRDGICYIVGLLTLALFFVGTSPGEIRAWEAAILFAEYVGYCILMKFNHRLQASVGALLGASHVMTVRVIDDQSAENPPRPLANAPARRSSALRTGVIELLRQSTTGFACKAGIGLVTQAVGSLQEIFDRLDQDKSGFIDLKELGQFLSQAEHGQLVNLMLSISQSGDSRICFEDFKKWYHHSKARIQLEVCEVFAKLDSDGSGTIEPDEIMRLLNIHSEEPAGQGDVSQAIFEIMSAQPSESIRSRTTTTGTTSLCSMPLSLHSFTGAVPDPAAPCPGQQEGAPPSSNCGTVVTFQQFKQWYNRTLFQEFDKHSQADRSAEDDDPGFSIEPPENPSLLEFLWYLVTYPVCAALYVTMPDVRRPQKNGYTSVAVVEFLLSLLWIGLFTLCLVEWVEVVSNTVGIPAPVAGVTVLAAGTSIPDLLSSFIVARQGEGDMAVSSSIGSNIFDILVGLALPWLCFCLVQGEPVHVETTSLGLSILVLVLMLLAVLAAIVCMGWKMTRRLGGVMFVLYGVFVVQSVLQEYPRGHPVIRVF